MEVSGSPLRKECRSRECLLAPRWPRLALPADRLPPCAAQKNRRRWQARHPAPARTGVMMSGLPVITVLPTGIAVAVVVLLTVTIWQFDRYRWGELKDLLARLWKDDRREVLHLEKQNGFFFFLDRLIPISEWVLRLGALLLGIPFFASPVHFSAAIVLLAFGIVFRSAVLTFLARKRVFEQSLPLEYDNAGIYARSAQDWREAGRGYLVWTFIGSLFLVVSGYFLVIDLVTR